MLLLNVTSCRTIKVTYMVTFHSCLFVNRALPSNHRHLIHLLFKLDVFGRKVESLPF